MITSEIPTLGSALAEGCRLIDRLDARLLLQFTTGASHTDIIVRSDRPIAGDARATYLDLVERRARGEPLAYLVGSSEFFGLTLIISPDVLIPRPETEILVERALECVAKQTSPRILDLGTGSGAIAIAIGVSLAAASPRITGIDVSPAAIAIAGENACRHKIDLQLIVSHWFAALGNRNKFDLIVANPPYVAADDPHLEKNGLPFEPQIALVGPAGNNDGLACITAIIETAPTYLDRPGNLLIEHGHDQAESVRRLLHRAGFEAVRSWPDLAGIERISGGRLSGQATCTS